MIECGGATLRGLADDHGALHAVVAVGLTDVGVLARRVEVVGERLVGPGDGLAAVEGAVEGGDVVAAAVVEPAPHHGRAGCDGDRGRVEGVALAVGRVADEHLDEVVVTDVLRRTGESVVGVDPSVVVRVGSSVGESVAAGEPLSVEGVSPELTQPASVAADASDTPWRSRRLDRDRSMTTWR